MPVSVVYPYKATLTDDQVRSWYADSVADGEVEAGCTTIEDMAAQLDDAGLITRGVSGVDYDGDGFDDKDFDYDDEYESEIKFADPGGRSALRAASPSNPRNLPCPNCGAANRLTPEDRRLGYQCDACSDLVERGGY